MRKKLLFIFNPHSGTGRICDQLAEVLDVFTKADYEVVTYPSQESGDATRKILAEGGWFDRIVVAGGDGMLNELVNGVMALGRPITVGYIPTGTVNDFARTHEIPRNIIEAAKIAASDNIKAVDVGKFGDKYFAYVAAFGIATNVPYETDQKAKKRWRFLAYLANFIKSVLGPNKLKAACRKMRVDAGDVVLRGEFVLGAVSNSRSIASVPYFVDKEVVLDDGRLECLFVPRPKNLKEWKRLHKNLKARDFSSSGLTFVRAERIEIQSEAAAWTLDGENGGVHEKIVISAQKQALQIALPVNDEI